MLAIARIAPLHRPPYSPRKLGGHSEIRTCNECRSRRFYIPATLLDGCVWILAARTSELAVSLFPADAGRDRFVRIALRSQPRFRSLGRVHSAGVSDDAQLCDGGPRLRHGGVCSRVSVLLTFLDN